MLLFRGADKTIQNFANQDAFQVAVIAGNSELAEIIRHFRPEDVGKFSYDICAGSSLEFEYVYTFHPNFAVSCERKMLLQ